VKRGSLTRAKVTRSALQNAASIAGICSSTTEMASFTDIPEKKDCSDCRGPVAAEWVDGRMGGMATTRPHRAKMDRLCSKKCHRLRGAGRGGFFYARLVPPRRRPLPRPMFLRTLSHHEQLPDAISQRPLVFLFLAAHIFMPPAPVPLGYVL